MSADGQWKKWEVYDRQQNKNEKKIRAKNDQDELSLLIKPNSPDTYNITARGDGCIFEGSTLSSPKLFAIQQSEASSLY